MLDITYFAHTKVDAHNQFSGIASDATFSQLYAEKKYYNHDIHMLQAETEEQLILEDAFSPDPSTLALHEDFSTLGYGHTFTILEINPITNEKECFHFASRLGNSKINERYYAHLDTLKHFVQYFKDTVLKHSDLKSAYDYKFSLDDTPENQIIFAEDLTTTQKKFIENLPTLTRIYEHHDIYITPREYECLYWLSQGKSIGEAAIILGLTQRTVKAHVTNAKERLHCDNLFQLGMIFNKIKNKTINL